MFSSVPHRPSAQIKEHDKGCFAKEDRRQQAEKPLVKDTGVL